MYTSITFLLAIVASVQAANNVAEKVTYTAAGASAVIGNHFGCAHSECFLLHPPTKTENLMNHLLSPPRWTRQPARLRQARFHRWLHCWNHQVS
jgi:hypothetical protein